MKNMVIEYLNVRDNLSFRYITSITFLPVLVVHIHTRVWQNKTPMKQFRKYQQDLPSTSPSTQKLTIPHQQEYNGPVLLKQPLHKISNEEKHVKYKLNVNQLLTKPAGTRNVINALWPPLIEEREKPAHPEIIVVPPCKIHIPPILTKHVIQKRQITESKYQQYSMRLHIALRKLKQK
ncbi:Hypothetical_protein [Hexamita inflata]|uniref:Hypothetical_protein n=1 Tax=Hexamita inflata TaxID=28002 RepID=A0AA86QKM9_9EUKA|nr:Hypothetical protein HINF_LOCUS43132 [Hexamita inflata]